MNSIENLVALSKWIDDGNAGRDPEAITWGRLAKLAEESGEVVAAYIGATGQNPRKGVTHNIGDVQDELLDVAITALGAWEHTAGHSGGWLAALNAKIDAVARRAGVVPDVVPQDVGPKVDVGTARPCSRAGFHEMWDGDRWVPICDVCGDEAAYCDGSYHKTGASR